MKRTKSCLACERFGIRPAAPAMDPTGRSADEADRLCRSHRIRVLRGYCFLCGVGKVWASPFSDRSIGCCRECVRKRHGINQARRIERDIELEEQTKGEGPEPEWRQN